MKFLWDDFERGSFSYRLKVTSENASLKDSRNVSYSDLLKVESNPW